MTIKQSLPWALVLIRCLGCPTVVLGAMVGWSGAWLSVFVAFILWTDIYDGVLARRWSCETPLLRLFDSHADTVFYLGVVWMLWIREPHAIRRDWRWLAALFGIEAGRYVFDFWKFGRPASYHSYLAKVWGLTIVVAVVGSLNTKQATVWIAIAVVFGIVVNIEGITMSLVLPRWRNDVKTLRQAFRIRREMLNPVCAAASPAA